MDTSDKNKVNDRLYAIRKRIDQCMHPGRPGGDRQKALEDVDQMLTDLLHDVRVGRL